MSAGAKGAYPGELPLIVHSDLCLLAPKMEAAVRAGLADCAENGIEAMVHETYREHATAVAYFKRGRSTIPPLKKVTNAPDETYSWHGYKLAVDIIHTTRLWDVSEGWYAMVAEFMERHGLKWGGHWNNPDLPHFQWGKCKASPSDRARSILRESGMEAVWRAVGAA